MATFWLCNIEYQYYQVRITGVTISRCEHFGLFNMNENSYGLLWVIIWIEFLFKSIQNLLMIYFLLFLIFTDRLLCKITIWKNSHITICYLINIYWQNDKITKLYINKNHSAHEWVWLIFVIVIFIRFHRPARPLKFIKRITPNGLLH